MLQCSVVMLSVKHKLYLNHWKEFLEEKFPFCHQFCKIIFSLEKSFPTFFVKSTSGNPLQRHHPCKALLKLINTVCPMWATQRTVKSWGKWQAINKEVYGKENLWLSRHNRSSMMTSSKQLNVAKSLRKNLVGCEIRNRQNTEEESTNVMRCSLRLHAQSWLVSYNLDPRLLQKDKLNAGSDVKNVLLGSEEVDNLYES